MKEDKYCPNCGKRLSFFYLKQNCPGCGVELVRQDGCDRYFKTRDGIRACRILIRFPEETAVRRVVLKENIRLSQRVESFRILAHANGRMGVVYEGSVIGYKKIAVLPEGTRADQLILEITDARIAPTLCFIGLYG